MIHQIRNLKNIYDLMALCCEAVMLDAQYDYNSGVAVKYMCEVNEIFAEYSAKCSHLSKRQAFEALKCGITEYLKKGADKDRIFAIVLVIDDREAPVVTERVTAAKSLIEYEALNIQYTDQVKIVPRKVDGFWDRVQKMKGKDGYPPLRKNREYNSRGIDYHLKNFYVWLKKEFDQKPVVLYRASKDSLLQQHFFGRMQISVGIVPLTKVHIKHIFEINCEDRKFEIKGLKRKEKAGKQKDEPEENLGKRYEEVYSRLAGRRLDFLLFPEMLMTEEILNKKEPPKAGTAVLTVNGSIWKDCTNQSIMTDGQGKKILSHLKKGLFEYENEEDGKKYLEHLNQWENKGYSILEIENFGRIGIAICKDVLEPDIRAMYKRLNINILLVPAYSPSSDFHSEARELAEQIGCVVVMVNSCGAMKKQGAEIGFICMPAKLGTERSSVIKIFDNQCCWGGCGNGCNDKTATIYFNQFIMYGDRTSFRVGD